MRENEAKLCWNETDNFSQQESSRIWHWLNLNRAGGREMDVSLQQTVINALKMSRVCAGVCFCAHVLPHLDNWDSVTVTTLQHLFNFYNKRATTPFANKDQYTSAWNFFLIQIDSFKTFSDIVSNLGLFKVVTNSVQILKIMKTNTSFHHVNSLSLKKKD